MKGPQHTDEELVRRFGKGDKDAFAEVYERFYNHLHFFAWRIIKNGIDAQDIAIETLESLFDRFQGFNTLGNIRAFLFITCRNKCLKYLDGRKRQQIRQQELTSRTDNNEDYVLAQMIRSEFLLEVYREIESLPPGQKEVFKLFYIDGLNHGEIARLLNISLDSVYNHKLRALKQLRIKLFGK